MQCPQDIYLEQGCSGVALMWFHGQTTHEWNEHSFQFIFIQKEKFACSETGLWCKPVSQVEWEVCFKSALLIWSKTVMWMHWGESPPNTIMNKRKNVLCYGLHQFWTMDPPIHFVQLTFFSSELYKCALQNEQRLISYQLKNVSLWSTLLLKMWDSDYRR